MVFGQEFSRIFRKILKFLTKLQEPIEILLNAIEILLTEEPMGIYGEFFKNL